ncbi:MAG: hypothetical protein H7290_09070 [Flavobacterium sp.]|nr:hypothetical protein [Aeromicrobium sp.]
MRAGIVASAVIFALTIIQLAIGAFGGLDQFEGKGFGYRLLVYPLLMLVVPAIWWRTKATTLDHEMPWGAFALLMSPFLIDVSGNTLVLYDSVEWWDNANHFVNWLLLLWGAGLLLKLLGVGPPWVLILTITSLGSLLAIGWELGEWYTFIRRGTELDGAYQDTLSDELLGTLGALVAGIIVGWNPAADREPAELSRR